MLHDAAVFDRYYCKSVSTKIIDKKKWLVKRDDSVARDYPEYDMVEIQARQSCISEKWMLLE